MRKDNIELVKGLEYTNLYREHCYVLLLRFNEKFFCVGFKEVDEETLKNYGFRFDIKYIDDKCDWNYLAMLDGIKEIEENYNPTYFSNLKDRFSKYLLKELKNDLEKEIKKINKEL